MVINAVVEAEKKIRTIKASVQPYSGSSYSRIFMGILGGNPSIQMVVLFSSFQSEEKNSMVA